MGTVILIVSLGAALNLALWGAIYHKLHGFPVSVWKVIERNRVVNETRALDALQAAAASRIGGLVIGIRTYHDQIGGIAQAQLAEAEVRARVSERRSSEAGVTLDAASALVRDLRALAEDLPSLFDRRAMETGIAIGSATARGGERRTSQRPLHAPAEPADEDRVSGDEDLTTVQSHPLDGTGAVPPSAGKLTSTGAPDGAS